MSFPLSACSAACAIQPAVLPSANRANAACDGSCRLNEQTARARSILGFRFNALAALTTTFSQGRASAAKYLLSKSNSLALSDLRWGRVGDQTRVFQCQLGC